MPSMMVEAKCNGRNHYNWSRRTHWSVSVAFVSPPIFCRALRGTNSSELKIGNPVLFWKANCALPLKWMFCLLFFFFFLKVCRAKALYKAGSHVASRWCSPNTPGEDLSLPAPTKVFPLAAVEAGFDPCWVLPPLRTVTPASGTRPPSQNFNSTCARLLMFLLTCFLRKICPFLCGVSQRW